jgi:hypothetical protein
MTFLLGDYITLLRSEDAASGLGGVSARSEYATWSKAPLCQRYAPRTVTCRPFLASSRAAGSPKSPRGQVRGYWLDQVGHANRRQRPRQTFREVGRGCRSAKDQFPLRYRFTITGGTQQDKARWQSTTHASSAHAAQGTQKRGLGRVGPSQ